MFSRAHCAVIHSCSGAARRTYVYHGVQYSLQTSDLICDTLRALPFKHCGHSDLSLEEIQRRIARRKELVHCSAVANGGDSCCLEAVKQNDLRNAGAILALNLDSNSAHPQKHQHHFDTHHRGTKLVPVNGVVGFTPNGVPVFSNGDEDHFSGITSHAPNLRLSTNPIAAAAQHQNHSIYERVGVRWQCVEFARRYMAISKAVWLQSVPIAEDIWHLTHPFSFIRDGTAAPSVNHVNGKSNTFPSVGDVLIWSRSDDTPFGHVATIIGVTNTGVQIAEQNQGFEEWPENAPYSRELPLRIAADGSVTLVDADPLLGWIHVDSPFADFSADDIPDNFRHILSAGAVVRCRTQPETSAKWLDPSSRSDHFLRRSLMSSSKDGGRAHVADVPNGYYVMDYDFWSRVRRATTSLHDIAMQATQRVLSDPNSESILVQLFGIPKELHAKVRRSFDVVPPMGGRMDFGYDGKRIVMLGYNCDSSASLLECSSTQEKWSKYNNVTIGSSTGSFLRARLVQYFQCLQTNAGVCPQHKLIHFMIGEDSDEQRYTALCAMECAEEAGFRCKLCVGLTDFHFATDSESSNLSPRRIVDADEEDVQLVWKTWTWDAVLEQYAEQRATELKESPSTESVSSRPTLSDVLLHDDVVVLEPLWKTVAGSKSILPFMYQTAPEQNNMVPARFELSDESIAKHAASIRENGNASQEMITMMNDDAARNTNTHPQNPLRYECISTGETRENVRVYQQHVDFMKFDGESIPVFSGWMIGNQFGGIAIRESVNAQVPTQTLQRFVPARVSRAPEDIAAYKAKADATYHAITTKLAQVKAVKASEGRINQTSHLRVRTSKASSSGKSSSTLRQSRKVSLYNVRRSKLAVGRTL